MEINLNLETLQQCCRACLQKGDISIWDHKVKINQESDEHTPYIDDSMNLKVFQMLEIFNITKNEILDLSEEIPLLCWQCLEDLKYCYIFLEKLKLANSQLKNLYQDALNQCIEEEHLIEPIEEEEKIEVIDLVDSNSSESPKEPENAAIEIISTPRTNEITEKIQILNVETIVQPRIIKSKKKSKLENNSAFIITQFIPSTLEPPEKNLHNQPIQPEEEEESPPAQHLLTMDYKVVEAKDLEHLESPIVSSKIDNVDPAVYVCQYCPQAFAKSEYLKTHIQKNHVCKFCTQPFSLMEDLYKHIREVHTEHKCVICLKNLSSHTNLRHHIRRVHRIKLPAKVTLIDYIKSTEAVEDLVAKDDEVQILQEEIVDRNFDVNLEYLLKTDCIHILSDNNLEMN